ncbi:hypothetical protein L226DRAFT_525325 [Lentinus tigrinus ALCF2SS1-7]|uniref:uncharacterized protein n=1 Tax=Lentinus tigrinus ALCF2SS1-7 TaxID=1328758 RepID=UPI0011662E8F|nr:hypothetical protein L226DRAFT_525325 [Lentinus tigrinus ALCF2SS1-7]
MRFEITVRDLPQQLLVPIACKLSIVVTEGIVSSLAVVVVGSPVVESAKGLTQPLSDLPTSELHATKHDLRLFRLGEPDAAADDLEVINFEKPHIASAIRSAVKGMEIGVNHSEATVECTVKSDLRKVELEAEIRMFNVEHTTVTGGPEFNICCPWSGIATCTGAYCDQNWSCQPDIDARGAPSTGRGLSCMPSKEDGWTVGYRLTNPAEASFLIPRHLEKKEVEEDPGSAKGQDLELDRC